MEKDDMEKDEKIDYENDIEVDLNIIKQLDKESYKNINSIIGNIIKDDIQKKLNIHQIEDYKNKEGIYSIYLDDSLIINEGTYYWYMIDMENNNDYKFEIEKNEDTNEIEEAYIRKTFGSQIEINTIMEKDRNNHFVCNEICYQYDLLGEKNKDNKRIFIVYTKDAPEIDDDEYELEDDWDEDKEELDTEELIQCYKNAKLYQEQQNEYDEDENEDENEDEEENRMDDSGEYYLNIYYGNDRDLVRNDDGSLEFSKYIDLNSKIDDGQYYKIMETMQELYNYEKETIKLKIAEMDYAKRNTLKIKNIKENMEKAKNIENIKIMHIKSKNDDKDER